MANLVTKGIAKAGAVIAGTVGINSGSGGPLSGTSGTGAKSHSFGPGSLYVNSANGVVYINEHTQASPYWTPVSYDQAGLRAWDTGFEDHVAKALSGSDATAVLASGVRIHGQGLAENDSGGVVAGVAERGAVCTLTTTNEAAHTIALGVGDTTLPFQPDNNGPLVIDCTFTHSSAITLRATFCGFIGAAANALDPVVTGGTTTLTLVLDDVAGMFQDVGLTDGDGIFLPHNKSNAAASIATSATGVDTSTTMAAAGTYTRWRVEISAAGVMTAFVNKVQKGSISAALDVDEELAPSFHIESTNAATKSVLVDRFSTWGTRA